MKSVATLKTLSPSSRRLFRELADEYDIRDSGGREILASALRSRDLAESAERQIAKDGATLTDRFGQLRAHPLSPVARDYRAQFVAGLKALNFAIGDAPQPGRPTGD